MPRLRRPIVLVLVVLGVLGPTAACSGQRPTLIDEPPPTTEVPDQTGAP